MTDPHLSGPGAEADVGDGIPEADDAQRVEDPLGPPGDHGDLTARGEPDARFGAEGPAAGAEVAVADADEADGADGEAAEPAVDRRSSSVEELIVDLERTIGERDDYLDQLRRNQADFENARRRLTKEATDAAARATESLVDKLLPVLDACDAAIAHGASEVEPIFASLLGSLEKEGLERISPAGEAFDPNRHEAVFHEAATDDDEGTVVSEVLRTGYGWKGRIVRPAMVKVRG
ncbi:hypothetical protein BH20ACT3_BH20ACT3_17570 [soil metagenome]